MNRALTYLSKCVSRRVLEIFFTDIKYYIRLRNVSQASTARITSKNINLNINIYHTHNVYKYYIYYHINKFPFSLICRKILYLKTYKIYIIFKNIYFVLSRYFLIFTSSTMKKWALTREKMRNAIKIYF